MARRYVVTDHPVAEQLGLNPGDILIPYIGNEDVSEYVTDAHIVLSYTGTEDPIVIPRDAVEGL